ncbi:MAG TPA: hypothetical protein VFM18_18065 [Methanosarcina sp.]|nr:hypothetical protein [Methanosarcina sp.]
MNNNFEFLKEKCMVITMSHGAFGEPERREDLDVDKFAHSIVLECIEIISGEPFGNTEAAEYLKKHFEV